MKKRNLSPVITGKTIDEVKKETNAIVSKLWTELNALSEKVNSQSVGQKDIESADTGVVVVKDGKNTYLEVRTTSGWERLNAEFQPKTKRT
jgi:hypothetical protein